MIRRQVRQIELNDKPYLIWNAFVDIATMENEGDLNEIQINGQRAFIYDSEIQNGGHLQFFENTKMTNYKPFIDALSQISAFEYAKILSEAAITYQSKQRDEIKDRYEYIKIALEGEFEKLDTRYYETKPDLAEFLEEYVKSNADQFVQITH